MSHPFHQPHRFHRLARRTAADHRRNARPPGDAVSHRPRAGAEPRHLKHAHRPVPQNRPASRQRRRIPAGGIRPDVHYVPPVGNPVGGHRGHRARFRPKRIRHNQVRRQMDGHPRPRRPFQRGAREFQPFRFYRRRPYRPAQRRQKSHRHAPADEQVIQPFQQIFQHQNLVPDLGPAHQRRQGPLRFAQRQPQGLHFPLHQQSHRRRQVPGQPHRRGVGPVGHRKGIHHETVRQ